MRCRTRRTSFPVLLLLLFVAACSGKGGPDTAAERWQVIGAFQRFDETIGGTVWLDDARHELRFELEGTNTRFKCIGPAEIDSSTTKTDQCRQIEGSFRLHCGVQRELLGSFEHNSCGFGFAAGIDSLTGSTVALHFDLSPDRYALRQEALENRTGLSDELLETDSFLESVGLDPEIFGLGTGFAITQDGYILTAAHVVNDQYGIRVHSGDRVADAEIVAVDDKSDLALLKTDLDFDPLPLAETTPGETFLGLAIGYRVIANSEPSQAAESAIMHRLTRLSFFGFEGDVIPGYSGGPVFVRPGYKVAGVIHAIAVAYEIRDWDDYDIEKLAYAVDYESMMDFLQRSLDPETLEAIAERSAGEGADRAAAGTDAIVLITVY